MSQKYNYAECLVQEALDTKVVKIALSPEAPEDKNIYYRCSGYEEFIELLAKAPIFTSVDDFTIKTVLNIY